MPLQPQRPRRPLQMAEHHSQSPWLERRWGLLAGSTSPQTRPLMVQQPPLRRCLTQLLRLQPRHPLPLPSP